MKNKELLIFIIVFILGILLVTGLFIISQNLNSNFSHIVATTQNNSNDLYYTTTIYTFKNNKCISERVKCQFKNSDLAEESYNNWKETHKNISIEDNCVYFNENTHSSMTPNDIISELKNTKNNTENDFNYYIY